MGFPHLSFTSKQFAVGVQARRSFVGANAPDNFQEYISRLAVSLVFGWFGSHLAGWFAQLGLFVQALVQTWCLHLGNPDDGFLSLISIKTQRSMSDSNILCLHPDPSPGVSLGFGCPDSQHELVGC